MKIGEYKTIKKNVLTEKYNSKYEKEYFLFDMLYGCDIVMDEENYPDRIFYMKDGKLMFEQNLKNDVFWVRYNGIWSVFQTKYEMNYEQIQEFTKYRLEEHLKCKVSTTTPGRLLDLMQLEEHLKCKVSTTLQV